jgi:hypothetical protein
MIDKERASALKLLKTIESAASELAKMLGSQGNSAGRFDYLDSRRRRPEWQRRGRVFYAIRERGGRVGQLEFTEIVLAAGYEDMRGANGFFRGDPLPVLERVGDEVVLTDRGSHAAKFYEQYWLPQESGQRAEGSGSRERAGRRGAP